ncbi:cation:proton antiporter [Clostridia bacterium]|nr:cation:proton antiporter [Clostridia bacterium]
MLFSIALITLLGFSLSEIFKKLALPGLLGMLATGILLGPYVLNLISPDMLHISADLREMALIVILIRAGLSLDLRDLKKVGRPAILMSFIPASFEIGAIILLAPILLGVTRIEAAILGAVVAAVSPAVVVPRMINLIESGYGKDKAIPQLIMAGASVDDIYVIILFTSFLGMYQGAGFSPMSLFKVPLSVILGLAFGIFLGFLMQKFFRIFHMRDTVKVLLILSISFLLVTLEAIAKPYVPFSALLAVMALSGTIREHYEILANRLMGKFGKIWVAAEILLFVLVGAEVDIGTIRTAGLASILLIVSALAFRMLGVNICLIKSRLNLKERLFCSVAYLPKATVQAAIGSIPLAAGVAAGDTILAVAVMAIIISAPIGAIGVDKLYMKLLAPPESKA